MNAANRVVVNAKCVAEGDVIKWDVQYGEFVVDASGAICGVNIPEDGKSHEVFSIALPFKDRADSPADAVKSQSPPNQSHEGERVGVNLHGHEGPVSSWPKDSVGTGVVVAWTSNGDAIVRRDSLQPHESNRSGRLSWYQRWPLDFLVPADQLQSAESPKCVKIDNSHPVREEDLNTSFDILRPCKADSGIPWIQFVQPAGKSGS